MRVLQVDIVVPVRNEERDLAPSVRRLVSYLREGFPFTARVTIADNGSTDGTWAIADRARRPARHGAALQRTGARVDKGPPATGVEARS
jgi:glycosyltransferase involved in cell wall biosynthesis